jgi:hypothetical protein
LHEAGDFAGPEYLRRYDAWLDWFERSGVEAVGFGWITLRAAGSQEPCVRIEERPHPIVPDIRNWFARQDFLRNHDDAALLDARLLQTDGLLMQKQLGPSGAEPPEHVVLHQRSGMRGTMYADAISMEFVDACDGQQTTGAILDAIAKIIGADTSVLRREFPALLRQLITDGFLTPLE